MAEPPNELPQDRWFWVWLSIFTILLGTAPFIVWQGYRWSGIGSGIVGLGGLLVLIRDRLKIPIQSLFKVLAVVVLIGLIGEIIGYDIINRQAVPPLGIGRVFVLLGCVCVIALIVVFAPKIRTANVVRKEQPKLVIHSALYGAGDAADVVLTDKLNEITKEGLVVPVNNNLVDHDPAPNKPKNLRVEYSYGAGDPRPAIFPEHSWLMLPENPQLLKLQSDVEVLQKRIESTQETPQFSDLAKRVLNLASRFKQEVKKFRAEHPEPHSPSTSRLARRVNSPSSPMFGGNDLKNGIAEHNAWRERAGAWYRHHFMHALEGIRDELGAQGLIDSRLNTAITETGLDKENTALVVQLLRSLALQLDDDPQERVQNDVTLPLTDNDPRVRLETATMPSDIPLFPSDLFVLHNEGGSTAYRVTIEDIDLSSSKVGKAIARFSTAETILPNDSKTVTPLIADDVSSVSFLLKWATEEDTDTKSVVITYYDYNDNEFKTGAELVYVPVADESPSEIAKDFSDTARQYHRKNPQEVIINRKEQKSASDIAVRNSRYWKVGRQ